MMMFFSESDLVAFGSYMVSGLREQTIRNNSELTEEEVRDRLKQVSDADMANWAYLVQQSQNNTENESKRN